MTTACKKEGKKDWDAKAGFLIVDVPTGCGRASNSVLFDRLWPKYELVLI